MLIRLVAALRCGKIEFAGNFKIKIMRNASCTSCAETKILTTIPPTFRFQQDPWSNKSGFGFFSSGVILHVGWHGRRISSAFDASVWKPYVASSSTNCNETYFLRFKKVGTLFTKIYGDSVARELPADDNETSSAQDVEEASAGNGRVQPSVPTFKKRRK